MRIHCLQHVPFEDPAHVAAWAAGRGDFLAVTHLYRGEELPAHDAYDLLLPLGGTMNVDEHNRHPWLATEKRFLRESIDAGKAVLGVCLGAQLVAEVLGGRVTRNAQREIGWFPVTLRPEAAAYPPLRDWPATFTAFHWHGDTFAIPPGARHVAASAACANQAFAWGERVVGLQFHLEYTEASILAMARECGDELTEGPWIQQPPALADGVKHLPTMHALLERMLAALERAPAASTGAKV